MAGAELPTFGKTEASIPELKECTPTTIAFIKGLKPTRIDSTEDSDITIKFCSGEREFRVQG